MGTLKRTVGILVILTGLLFLSGGCEVANSGATSDRGSSEEYSQLSEELESLTRRATVFELNKAIQEGEITSLQLTQFYLQKIKQEDSQFNSVITVNPDALMIAKQLDREAAQGQYRSPLHGLPILIKDNIETKDMPTTAGSLALQNNVTERDATLVSRLREAGAVILGKTNLSEWANIRSLRSSSGWSAIGGQTRNPHDITRSTCGSSSGSAAAIAANFAVAAIGTETDGSITCPASMTGIVGFKPTVGAVSRFGIVPISHTQDTAGPMAKSVTDAAIITQVLSAFDPKDKATEKVHSKTRQFIPSVVFNSFYYMNNRKIALLHSSATEHEAVAAIENNFVEQLKAKHQVEFKPKFKPAPPPSFWGDSYQVLLFQLKHTLNQYLANLPNEYNQLTLAQLIEFNQAHRESEMRYFQQEIFESAEQKGELDSVEYQSALKSIQEEARDTLNGILENDEVDVAIAITRGPAWKIDLINGDHFNGGVSTFAAIAGYPHITIPLDNVHGLPIGLSIIGKAGDDSKVLQVGIALEEFIQNRYTALGLEKKAALKQ